MSELPLVTALGVGLGGLFALIAAALSLGPLEATPHPLLLFALAPAPALLGAWIDWARLYRPTPRVRRASFALFAASAALAISTGLAASSMRTVLWAPLALFLFAPLAALGARALERWPLGFRIVTGRVRHDELDRVVLDTDEGALELGRDVAALDTHREVDLGAGAPLAVLASIDRRVDRADPFRVEPRSTARSLVAVASSEASLRAGLRARGRAWASYLLALAIGVGATASAMAYTPSSVLEKDPWLTTAPPQILLK